MRRFTSIGHGAPACITNCRDDTSASARYFAEDLTEPFVLGEGEHRGQLRVPDAPGTGVTVRQDLLRAWATAAPVVLTP